MLIEHAMAGNLAKPARELLRLAQAAEVFPGREECFLGDVFGSVQVAAGGVDQATDQPLIAANDLTEGLAIALATGRHQINIRLSDPLLNCDCSHGSPRRFTCNQGDVSSR